ncbi:MAG: hypothetical protein MJ252_27570 [archaeon]|nr:hypothetical protein [archaeon]
MEQENDYMELAFLFSKLCDHTFEDKPKIIGLKKINFTNISFQNLSVLSHLEKLTKYCLISPLEIVYKEMYEKEHKISEERDKCSICLCGFYEDELESNADFSQKNFQDILNIEPNVIQLEKCEDHFFHISCLGHLITEGNKFKDNFKCPLCSKIYGTLKGKMPPGTMSVYLDKWMNCSGFHTGTIVIDYNFPGGRGYSGTSRRCFLPNTDEGIEILALLKVSFERRQTFKVGTSITTGAHNATVWNGIHHKTSTSGGATNFGYPDQEYFFRVREELAEKGVTPSSIPGDLKQIGYSFLSQGSIRSYEWEGMWG